MEYRKPINFIIAGIGVLVIFILNLYAENIAYIKGTKVIIGSKVSTTTAVEAGRIDISGYKTRIAGANTAVVAVGSFTFSLPASFEYRKYMLSPANTTYVPNPNYNVSRST